MATCYQMVLLRLPHHPLLEGVDDPLWAEYIKRILGKDVMGWVVRDSAGSELFRAPWAAILAYDHEIRKEACMRANSKQAGYGNCLREAMADRDLYTLKFVLPLSATAASGRRSPAAPQPATAWNPHIAADRNARKKLKKLQAKLDAQAAGAAPVG